FRSANAIYQLVAPWRHTTADKLAFARRPEEFRCAAIVELADDFDYGYAIVRQLLCDRFDLLRLARLARSSVAPVAQLAARMHAEERNHVSHADEWVMRLGQGGRDSRTRVQAALERLAPHAASLFEPTEGQERLEAAGVYPPLEAAGATTSPLSSAASTVRTPGADMFGVWQTAVQRVLADAGLRATFAPSAAGFVGGRRGKHTPEFAPLRSEMTEVAAADPEATW
ncbi:MAG: Phenylacetic acid catabolic protein, partial [Phycisphaerae bacterium]